jgi:hypothetical protein
MTRMRIRSKGVAARAAAGSRCTWRFCWCLCCASLGWEGMSVIGMSVGSVPHTHTHCSPAQDWNDPMTEATEALTWNRSIQISC